MTAMQPFVPKSSGQGFFLIFFLIPFCVFFFLKEKQVLSGLGVKEHERGVNQLLANAVNLSGKKFDVALDSFVMLSKKKA